MMENIVQFPLFPFEWPGNRVRFNFHTKWLKNNSYLTRSFYRSEFVLAPPKNCVSLSLTLCVLRHTKFHPFRTDRWREPHYLHRNIPENTFKSFVCWWCWCWCCRCALFIFHIKENFGNRKSICECAGFSNVYSEEETFDNTYLLETLYSDNAIDLWVEYFWVEWDRTKWNRYIRIYSKWFIHCGARTKNE